MKTWINSLIAGALFCGGMAVCAAAPQPLKIVYFVTKDRKPLANYEERLDRVMKEVQRFYRDGMAAAGFPDRTFALETNQQGRLLFHVVQAAENMEAYGRNSSDKVRREVKTALKKEGIDIDRETIVIFQTLLKWEGERAIEVGPYVGGGSHLSGTAWVYDDERLDSNLLDSKAPGGFYGRPCSIGEFNSHYVGGIAHELGHALSLPHVSESRAQRSQGAALMGGGNHSYGNNKRGEGRGTFLHPVSAMLLAHVRAFAGELPQANLNPKASLDELSTRFENGKLTLIGKIKSSITPCGVVAYDDLEKIPADYDAVGWLGKLYKGGRFQVDIGELRAGASQLRLVMVCVNGARSVFSFDYTVDARGVPDTSSFEQGVVLDKLGRWHTQRDRNQIELQIQEWEKRNPKPDLLLARARHLLRLMNPPTLIDISEIPAAQKTAAVSTIKFARENVGWGRPLRDCVLAESQGHVWLQVGRTFYAQGLFAHAPATHELELVSGWKTFHSSYGLQDGTDGSVVFVVRGDGRELFRSQRITDHVAREITVSLEGVRRLELAVEDAKDGKSGDWGVWLNPELRR